MSTWHSLTRPGAAGAAARNQAAARAAFPPQGTLRDPLSEPTGFHGSHHKGTTEGEHDHAGNMHGLHDHPATDQRVDDHAKRIARLEAQYMAGPGQNTHRPGPHIFPGRSMPDWAGAVEARKDYSDAQRKQLAAKGWALPDGSYPIVDAEDLGNAAKLAQSGHGDAEAAKALIRQRAEELNVPDPLAGGDAAVGGLTAGGSMVQTGAATVDAPKPGQDVVKAFTPHDGALERVPKGDPHNGHEWTAPTGKIGSPVIKTKAAK